MVRKLFMILYCYHSTYESSLLNYVSKEENWFVKGIFNAIFLIMLYYSIRRLNLISLIITFLLNVCYHCTFYGEEIMLFLHMHKQK